EFPRSMISKVPFANAIPPLNDAFKRLQGGAFADWRLSINGMVAQPASLSLADLRSFPVRSQITEVVCEEGWSYVAEWIGTPLFEVLKASGVLPQGRYLVYFSIDPDWWESIDMADVQHPQTLLTWAMNDGDLPVAFGGPLRLRVPRQLGYKSVKFVTWLRKRTSRLIFCAAAARKNCSRTNFILRKRRRRSPIWFLSSANSASTFFLCLCAFAKLGGLPSLSRVAGQAHACGWQDTSTARLCIAFFARTLHLRVPI